MVRAMQFMAGAAAVGNEDYEKEIENARAKLTNAITCKDDIPIYMLRLAYASQFSIAPSAAILKTADQPDPSQPKTDNEKLPVAYNHDLQNAIDLCEEIKRKHPTITYADLYQLAGVVAVKALEGPNIDFVPGRKDSSVKPDEGCLPDGKQDSRKLREVLNPMGLDDKDIVALCGGLYLARAHPGAEGSQPKKPLKFDNSYFKSLMTDSSSLKLPTDKALVEDESFRDIVKRYANDQDTFFRDYKESHKKLSEQEALKLSENKPPPPLIEAALRNPMAQKAIGVAVAAAVAILSFFYLFKRRRAKPSSQQTPPITMGELNRTKNVETEVEQQQKRD